NLSHLWSKQRSYNSLYIRRRLSRLPPFEESFFFLINPFEESTSLVFSVMGTRINFDLAQGVEFRFHAKDDGIYFTHGKEEPKLEYKWICNVLDMAPSP
ncbi:hypothetical protein HID58_008176, partial [Brassica napus]